MLAHRYKIWMWGEERKGGQEDCVKYDASVTVVAKRHRYVAYEVFNELVSMELGRFMGLPIPVGMVLEKDGDPYYCSANISPEVPDFPPADIEHLAAHHPSLFCGILVFDVWICNDDRHAGNIFYDEDGGDVFLIDHGQAVLNSLGPSYLRHRLNELGIRGDFAAEARDFTDFSYWCDRLIKIPYEAIQDTCSNAAAVGVATDEAAEAARQLISRRDRIRQLFRDNESFFPNRQPSIFEPFKGDDKPGYYTI